MEILFISFDITIFDFIAETAITAKYTVHRTFKKAYHLHDLRFALTLYKRAPGETEFRECDDMQYISQISTEDKKRKKIYSILIIIFSLSFLDKISKK